MVQTRVLKIIASGFTLLFTIYSLKHFPPTTNCCVKISTPEPIEEAFVTFCDSNPDYLALLETVLDSVHHFSTRPIIVYGIDVDLKLNFQKYPRSIQRRLKQSDCGQSIYFCKLAAIVHSNVRYGIYIETDTLVNWNVDVLFDVLHQWSYALPIAPRHPNDPRNYKRFLKQFDLDFSNRTTPYIHAHLLWTFRSYGFLREALAYMQKGYFLGANYDETGINVLLWKAKANHTLCKIDPFFTFLSVYEARQRHCTEFCHTAFILVHGSKNSTEMRDLFDRLKRHAGFPFIQTVNNGFHYLNQSEHSCCYPDSRPSSIHPLLCEHSG
ncbi:unnamed protein product [Adineta ricciae]|uniref:Uncharacterized protein n=1 Tax=Adineta ricciae TaxID=249248 RepID=A0A814T1G2_ADIRI|nr:unnamed protein product [Adineta ricciae]CAF1155370.1 unnamed protein product [Adineta ricciae]